MTQKIVDYFNEHKELSVSLDINEEIAVVSYEPDDEVKEKKNITLTTEVIPFYLEKLDAIAQEHGGHLALGRVCHCLACTVYISDAYSFHKSISVDLG